MLKPPALKSCWYPGGWAKLSAVELPRYAGPGPEDWPPVKVVVDAPWRAEYDDVGGARSICAGYGTLGTSGAAVCWGG